ncbi:hypothetical protein HCA78_01670 [Listeria booriae]|uniref:Bacterial Ig domain-containing protein n=1 Tax=Listeria booriae TaxID=1552123 RepID=A0A842CX58_9LIST|nr:immunoglobulin-like domain-containing protein [Listeria booriae]MBC2002457.1 hypothetical protein [Listeria booriae]
MKKTTKKIGIILLSASLLTTTVYNPAQAATNGIESPKAGAIKSIIDSDANAKKYLTTQQLEDLQKIMEENKESGSVRAQDFDPSITSLTLKYTGKHSSKADAAFVHTTNSDDPYSGVANYKLRIGLQGKLNGKNAVLPNGDEFIKDYENGNFGGRITVRFPKGTDARSMYQAMDWSKTSATSNFTVRIAGITTLVWELKWPVKVNPQTVKFDPSNPNEFSIMVNGIKKSEVSESEWNKYDPISVYAALVAAGLAHIGDMDGYADVKLSFDLSKYSGNTDDTTTNKELTAKRLPPSKNRLLNTDIFLQDRTALIAGETGAKNISGAITKPGFEYVNPLPLGSKISTWSDYLSIWDRNDIYNTQLLPNAEVEGINTSLPGKSIFDRSLTVKDNDDFNKFKSDRFNRVINYFSKKESQDDPQSDLSNLDVKHAPQVIPNGVETPVTYSGVANYYNGDSRALIRNVLKVTNKANIETYLTANDYKISPSNQYVTGTNSKNVDKVKLFVNGADRMTAAGNNNGEGQYKIYAYDFIKNVSDNVIVKALDKDGQVIKETKVNIEKGESVQTYLKANDYKIAPNSQYVSGTHSTDVEKIKLFVNGVDRMTAGANNNGAQGQYRIYAYDFIKSTSDNVVVKALNKSGQVIKETKVNITQDTGSITASNFKINTDELINGTFTGNIAVVKLYVDGVAKNQVRPTGSSYSLYAAGYVTSTSQNVVVTGFDANGVQVASQKVNVTN